MTNAFVSLLKQKCLILCNEMAQLNVDTHETLFDSEALRRLHI